MPTRPTNRSQPASFCCGWVCPRRLSIGAPSAANSGATAKQMPFGNRLVHGGCLIGADAQRADPKSIAAVAVEVDLHVQRRERRVALRHETLEGDRQTEAVPVDVDLAVVERVAGTCLVEVMADGGQSGLIEVVDHGSALPAHRGGQPPALMSV